MNYNASALSFEPRLNSLEPFRNVPVQGDTSSFIGVLLAPTLRPAVTRIATGIFDSGRNRPQDLPDDPNKPDFGMKNADDMKRMMEEAAETALQGIHDGKFWILPLTEEIENAIQACHDSIMNRTDPPIVQLDG